MLRRALRICGRSGCSSLGAEGLCPEHQQERARRGFKRSQYATPAARGYDAQHRVMRALIWQEQHGRCAGCARPTPQGPQRHLDHVVPKSKGGSNEPDNLVGLCSACHRTKTGHEGAAARWGA